MCHIVTSHCGCCCPHFQLASLSSLHNNMPKTSKISNKEIPPPFQIKHRDKAMWFAAEEATIIATLLLQKATGNSSESGFKPVVWPLVVNAVGEATSESVR